MSKIPLIIDAWIREAQEASQWLEDLEGRIKHKGLVHSSSLHSSRSKLLEIGVKLDRLESLLRNLPAKPILTDEDVEYRWKMLKDIQLRTKSLVSSISAAPSPNWARDVPAADSEECNVSPDSYDQELTKTPYAKDNTELQKPLVMAQAEVVPLGQCFPYGRVAPRSCYSWHWLHLYFFSLISALPNSHVAHKQQLYIHSRTFFKYMFACIYILVFLFKLDTSPN